MELITKLILLALAECYERSVIEWHPEDGVPDSLIGECEIELNWYTIGWGNGSWNGDWHVVLFDVYCIIDAEHLECWHSSKLEIEEQESPTFAQGECPNCGHDWTAHSAWIANPGDTTCIEIEV